VTEGRNPFMVNAENATEVLMAAWHDYVDEVWLVGEEWGAHVREAPPDDDIVSGSTPDELNVRLREHWAQKGGDRG
jgi:hypothetical protein